jgi:hypothetical protein
MKLDEDLKSTVISDRIKTEKTKSDRVISKLNNIDAVSARQVTTDEFDIPPSAVIKIEIDLEKLPSVKYE